MNSPQKDKDFLNAVVSDLEPYLLSNELYWPTAVHTPDFTQLTPGVLLLVRERVRGWKLPLETDINSKLDETISKWRSAWQAKARREIGARSALWKEFLTEARLSTSLSARRFPTEVRQRAILSLLLNQLPKRSDKGVTALDQVLHEMWQPGDFIWPPELKSVFPMDPFWFLYGTLNAEEN